MQHPRTCLALAMWGILFFTPPLCLGQASRQTWPGTKSQWHEFDRYDFQVNGRSAYVVLPKQAAPGNPWVWRARFPDYHAEADVILLQRGFHIARINTDGMLGSPSAMQHWDQFYAMLLDHGLAERVALEGVSRGGLFVYGFASRWPERVACIYCDTPVLDIRSWPGGKGAGIGHEQTWQSLLKQFNLTEATAAKFNANPIDTLEPLAKESIPLLHIVSLNDSVVPPLENTSILAERYRALGGNLQVIEVSEGTPESHGHHFTHPNPVCVADFIELHATACPNGKDYFELRGSLDNCRMQFERNKFGRVAFMGGSITEMHGWREGLQQFLRERFPETEFDFIDAGIASTGSTPGAFRLARDVLSKGKVDLLLEEAAVNDLHNGRAATEITRGMEGIIRHARRANPAMDIVLMHFVDPQHMADYRAGKTPQVIALHESVAKHYDVPTIHLAKEVTERIEARQFDWEKDFVDLHPSPYGHRLYASTIRRLFSAAWEQPLAEDTELSAHEMPTPLDQFSYTAGKMVSLNRATLELGFELIDNCDPRAGGVGGAVRGNFHNVPMLVGTQPGDTFSLIFHGKGIGLFVAAGPDAGTIEYSIDGKAWQTLDLFTRWSERLHIPWVYVLEAELEPTQHVARVRIAKAKHKSSKGHACRIVNLLVNEIVVE